jgi:hypothetical protein
MFGFHVDVACQNTFVVYKKKSGGISSLDFPLTLAESFSAVSGLLEAVTRD